MFFLFLQPVKSKLYAVLLQTLLAHSVPEVLVSHITNISNPIFLDAREYNEFEVSHIKTAIWVGYNTFSVQAVKNLKHDANIIVYCSVGYRSEKITERLLQMGFTNVFNLVGGIFEWKNQGHAVYSTQNKITEKVHAYNKTWGVWLTKGEKVY